jgi:mRNA interferase HigB
VFVISRSRLREFWERPGQGAARIPLLAWFRVAEEADWATFAEVKAPYATASLVGNCVVFNIAGNSFRLVARIIYPKHRVYVLKVMTHGEYDDQDRWQRECGCHNPPPRPRETKPRPQRILRKRPSSGKPKRSRTDRSK